MSMLCCCCCCYMCQIVGALVVLNEAFEMCVCVDHSTNFLFLLLIRDKILKRVWMVVDCCGEKHVHFTDVTHLNKHIIDANTRARVYFLRNPRLLNNIFRKLKFENSIITHFLKLGAILTPTNVFQC